MIMAPNVTAKSRQLYEAMFIAERAWERAIADAGLDRYSHAATGYPCGTIRKLYLARANAMRAYFDNLREEMSRGIAA